MNARHHMPRLSLAVLMTVHNRRRHTLECLDALMANEGIERFDLSVVMVDDGSTDGTAEAVAAAYPLVKIIHGDGSLFWNKGMYRAFATAMEEGFDYYLWLNDDTMLERNALRRLIEAAQDVETRDDKAAVVVGSTMDQMTERLTYGAQRKTSNLLTPLYLPVIEPTTEMQPCDTMNGNIVLIPAEVARVVGNLDPVFEHAMGDTDYGFRVRRAGFGLWLAPGYFGYCAHNPIHGSFVDNMLPLRVRWQKMMGPKGLPWRSWLAMTRRYAGLAWPIHFVWPYLKLVLSIFTEERGTMRQNAD